MTISGKYKRIQNWLVIISNQEPDPASTEINSDLQYFK